MKAEGKVRVDWSENRTGREVLYTACLVAIMFQFEKYGMSSAFLCSGKGLTMVVSVLKGKFTEMVAETIAAKQTLKRFVSDNKIHGFCQVISSSEITEGLAYM